MPAVAHGELGTQEKPVDLFSFGRNGYGRLVDFDEVVTFRPLEKQRAARCAPVGFLLGDCPQTYFPEVATSHMVRERLHLDDGCECLLIGGYGVEQALNVRALARPSVLVEQLRCVRPEMLDFFGAERPVCHVLGQVVGGLRETILLVIFERILELLDHLVDGLHGSPLDWLCKSITICGPLCLVLKNPPAKVGFCFFD